MRTDWSMADPIGSDKDYPWVAEAQIADINVWVTVWAGQSRDDALADLKELSLNPNHRIRIRKQHDTP